MILASYLVVVLVRNLTLVLSGFIGFGFGFGFVGGMAVGVVAVVGVVVGVVGLGLGCVGCCSIC